MSKNIGHLQHVKSSVVENGQPKLPTSNVLVEGELAINYAKGYETISLRNSESGITRFSSDDYYTLLKLGSGFTGANSAVTVTDVIRDDEKVIAAALNDLDGRKMDLSAYTPTDLSGYYTKEEIDEELLKYYTKEQTSGSTELEEEFNKKVNATWLDEKLGSAFTGVNSATTVTKYIEDNEETISAALNDLETRKMDISSYTPTDLSDYYRKEETSGSTELNAEFDKKVDITWIDEKLGSGFTGANSGNTVTDVIEKNEKVIAASLNDLKDTKLDISAYTEGSANYYTKSETSGKTEISNALNQKANISDLSTHTANTDIHVTVADKEDWDGKADKSWIEEKLGSGFTDENSATTVTEVLEEFEEVASAALNDLNDRKMDLSAYTPTDLSGYYTKDEVDGIIDSIITALSGQGINISKS